MMNYATKQPYPNTGAELVVSGAPNSPCYPRPVVGLDMTSVKNWLGNKNSVIPVSNGVLVVGSALALLLAMHHFKAGPFAHDFDYY